MKSVSATTAACLLCIANGHPIDKVITLLKELSSKAGEEGKTEAISFGNFMHWCKKSETELGAAIKAGKSRITSLTDEIGSEQKLIDKLNLQIQELTDEISKNEAAAAEAVRIRTEEHDLYLKSTADLEATIEGVKMALVTLKESDGTFLSQRAMEPHVMRALALAETSNSMSVRQISQAVMQEEKGKPKQLAEGDRELHVKKYDFKSNSVIELLAELQRKFEDDLLAAKKAEKNALAAFELAKKAREAAKAAAEKSKGEKESNLAETTADQTANKADLADVQDNLKADTKTLSDTDSACKTKAREWEERSKVRAAEIDAIKAAIKILGKATGVRTEAPARAGLPASPVLLQISDPRREALNLIRAEARATRSGTLKKMAQLLAAHINDPFKQVNNMIEKMIFHLKDEQNDEDNHKAWCDQEIDKSNTSRMQKEEKIDELSTKIDAATASIAELVSEIAAAREMIEKINTFMTEATELRKSEKKENKAAIEDAQQAQSALANAIAVLTEFYKGSGMVEKEAWELVQRGVTLGEKPATWDSSYTGVADPKNQPGGILSVLGTVAQDFSQMEADTRAQEATDQKEYDVAMSENKIEMASRTTEVEMKEQQKTRLSNKLDALKQRHKAVSAEFDAVKQYLEDLKPACVDGDSSYEDRKAARSKEIEALKRAEEILAKAFEESDSTMLVAVHRH